MSARIVSLPKHNGVLVGRDIRKIFKPGYVYEVYEYFGEMTVKCVGKSALPDDSSGGQFPNALSSIESIMCDDDTLYIITEEEKVLRTSIREAKKSRRKSK
jgi:hypothetical protein